MSSMFRLLRGEMHKILMRPILYVITGVLVLALFFSVTLLSMTNRSTTEYTIAGDTKDVVMQNYLSAESINKTLADKNMSDTLAKIEYYSTINQDPATTVTAQLKTLIKSAQDLLISYKYQIQQEQIAEPKSTNLSNLDKVRNDLSTCLKDLQEVLDNATKNNVIVLMEKTDFDTFTSLTSTAIIYLDATIDVNNLNDHEILVDKVSNVDGYTHIEGPTYLDKLTTIINQRITDVFINEELITSLNTQFTTASTYLSTLNTNIVKAVSDDTITLTEMKSDVLAYFYTAKQMNDLATASLYIEPIKGLTDSRATKYIGYNGIQVYTFNEEITRNNYLIANNLSGSDYASVFSPTMSFSNQVSAFDLVYFGLEICGFVILIFCVILAAGMIAGEHTNGTLKVLAVRPYSRSKILSSKILATLLFGTIFVLFSAIVLLIVGITMFGLDMTPILAVFNASSAFVISPALLILIYIVMLLFKILFYVLLATMISVVFR
ncbi:MAG: ABC transporter permease subunit, partial [Clostridia bacterium]|nr:ABC transporter permease subunit [Clostridia bacterium]